MAVRKPVRRAASSRQATTRKAAPATPAKRGRPVGSKNKPKPDAAPKTRDVTVYAEKEPTDYHKAFAQWIVRDVGYRPSQAASLKEAFLMGVSIATAARPAFMESTFLAEWREKTGTAKRGPAKRVTKQTDEKPVAVEDDDDDFEDEVEDDDDFDEDEDEDDDDFDEESEEDDDDDDDDFEDEVEEEKPAPKRRVPSKSATKSGTRTATRTRAKPVEDDDDEEEFAF